MCGCGWVVVSYGCTHAPLSIHPSHPSSLLFSITRPAEARASAHSNDWIYQTSGARACVCVFSSLVSWLPCANVRTTLSAQRSFWHWRRRRRRRKGCIIAKFCVHTRGNKSNEKERERENGMGWGGSGCVPTAVIGYYAERRRRKRRRRKGYYCWLLCYEIHSEMREKRVMYIMFRQNRERVESERTAAAQWS